MSRKDSSTARSGKALFIRNARPTDIPAIVEIQNASSSAAHWSESHYGRALDNPGGLILVAEREQVGILGFAVASTAVSEWELESIAVDSAVRRSGIGRALMVAVIGQAREAHATEIRQEIRESNIAAQNLGLSVGFIQEGRRPDYYRDPVEDALLFKHLLDRQ